MAGRIRVLDGKRTMRERPDDQEEEEKKGDLGGGEVLEKEGKKGKGEDRSGAREQEKKKDVRKRSVHGFPAAAESKLLDDADSSIKIMSLMLARMNKPKVSQIKEEGRK